MNNSLHWREADHPRETYQTPGNVLNDNKLSKQQKIAILRYWKEDIVSRLEAEGEGMARYSPISAEKEAALADEESAVNRTIAELESDT